MTKAKTKGQKQAQKAMARACVLSGVTISVVRVESDMPPPEQLHRPHETSDGRGKPKVTRFRDSSPLDAAFARGTVTARHVAAGDHFASAYRAAGGTTGPRSCLDWSPRGHSENVTAREIDAADRWRKLSQQVGMIRRAILQSICVMHEPIGDARALRHQQMIEGLNVVADFFGLPVHD